MLFVCFRRTFWTPAAAQRSRAICTWRSLDASPGRNSTCSCDAPGSTTLRKEHPRWWIAAVLIQQNVKINVKTVKQFKTVLLLTSLCFPTTTQEPRHLQLLSDLEDSNIFTIITGRKLHNAPTDYQFCIKVTHTRKRCNLSNSLHPLLEVAIPKNLNKCARLDVVISLFLVQISLASCKHHKRSES